MNIFGEHPREKLQEWANRLELFRYIRRLGGFADDGDSFICSFAYKNEKDLEFFCKFIGIELVKYKSKPPTPEEGRSYSVKERKKFFPAIVPGTNWIKQPGHSTISGGSAHIWCSSSVITISSHVSNPSWSVTEENVVNAEKMEHILKKAPLELIEPPIDNQRCLCQKYYPFMFS